ncbi:hypothetical protein [Catellatospora citrea]|uniref:Uncharacterized protein n=1 Tax=Catellatospora citrea TaxID=53366 RepID=A0A8J3NZ10_9ACTN|nr:hypothetical protein [Catellatospora citrea]RKE10115.1 hypothetical protein C8E86_5009 [Catellatospora citrea]GIF97975.1 hypothetical protein Cci01nite_30690 [Catellatospora citrea]
MTVIDLGADWAVEPAQPTLPRRGSTVRAAAAVCGVLLACTMTAAAPAPEPRLTELARWAEPQALLLATAGADTLLVHTPAGVTAYDAADGRRRWSLPGSTDWVHDVGDVLVLGFSRLENTSAQPQFAYADAVAVDRSTGRVRWRAEAYLEQVAGMLVSFSGNPERPVAQVHDPATFALRWRVAAARSFVVDRWGSAVWELAADGGLVERELATGAVRRSARVRLPGGTRVAVLASRDAIGIVGYRFDAGGIEEHAEVLWYDRADLAATGAENRWAWEADCGAGTSCAYPYDNGPPYLVDSATGAPIRPLEGSSHVGSPAGLLLFDDGGEPGTEIRARLEPAGHRARTDVAGWRVLSMTGQVARILGHEDGDPFATHVAELTADGLRPLGREPHGLVQCASVPRAMACTTKAGEVVIWRIGEERP